MSDPSYYAIIPSFVRYDKRLKPLARMLYGEITALANAKGYCWATNAFFASVYEVSKETISRWIKDLKKYGYIKIQIITNDQKVITERRIFINDNPQKQLEKKEQDSVNEIVLTKRSIPIDEKINTPHQKDQGGIDEKIKGVLTKRSIPIDENVKDNITINNTLINTINNKENNKEISPPSVFLQKQEEIKNRILNFKHEPGKQYKYNATFIQLCIDYCNSIKLYPAEYKRRVDGIAISTYTIGEILNELEGYDPVQILNAIDNFDYIRKSPLHNASSFANPINFLKGGIFNYIDKVEAENRYKKPFGELKQIEEDAEQKKLDEEYEKKLSRKKQEQNNDIQKNEQNNIRCGETYEAFEKNPTLLTDMLKKLVKEKRIKEKQEREVEKAQ